MRLLAAVALLAACSSAGESVVTLPALDGMSTLLALRSDTDLVAFDLRSEPRPTLKWTPEDDGDQLLLGLYRGTIASLELDVTEHQVALEPEGRPVPLPAQAFAVSAAAAIGVVTPEQWSAAPHITGGDCAPLRSSLVPGLPTGMASGPVAAPGGSGVLAQIDGEVRFIDRTGARVVSRFPRDPFEGKNGDVWLVEDHGIVRLDARLARVETLHTDVLTSTIVRGVESSAAVGPRFFFMGNDLELYAWDGIHAATPLAMPRLGREKQVARLSARPDGALWVAEGGLFGEYSPAGVWHVEELAPVGSFSSLVETTEHGTLFVARTRSPTDTLVTRVFARENGPTWAPLFPENFVDSRVMVEHAGRVFGVSNGDVVEVATGQDERPPLRCKVVTLAPSPDAMISTPIGLFAMGLLSTTALVYATWLD